MQATFAQAPKRVAGRARAGRMTDISYTDHAVGSARISVEVAGGLERVHIKVFTARKFYNDLSRGRTHATTTLKGTQPWTTPGPSSQLTGGGAKFVTRTHRAGPTRTRQADSRYNFFGRGAVNCYQRTLPSACCLAASQTWTCNIQIKL